MNNQNLTAPPVRSSEEAAKRGRNGGIASGRARLRKKHGRELLQTLLAMKEQDPQVVSELARSFGLPEADITKEVAMHIRQVDKAIRKGDTAAYSAVNKTAGYDRDEAAADIRQFNLVIAGEADAAALAQIINRQQ